MTTTTMTCRVCGEPADESNSALCNVCDERFHLNPRNDRAGRDCGDVWLNEEYMALEFACFVCLGRAAPAGEAHEPPVGPAH